MAVNSPEERDEVHYGGTVRTEPPWQRYLAAMDVVVQIQRARLGDMLEEASHLGAAALPTGVLRHVGAGTQALWRHSAGVALEQSAKVARRVLDR